MLSMLLLLSSFSSSGHGTSVGCRSDGDCSLVGTCSGGSCTCGLGWVGEHCERLDLLPVQPLNGLDLLSLNRTSTWGGAVVPRRRVAPGSSSSSGGGGGGAGDAADEAGDSAEGRRFQQYEYHMYYSELERSCGINSWLSNSVVRHAVASEPAGPYRPRPGLVWPIFSHEPTLATAPTGETVMFFTHNPTPVTIAGTCNCSTGNSTADCPTDWDKARGRDWRKPLLTYTSHTRADEDAQQLIADSSWSTPVAVPQADPLSDTAFSATILQNGSLVAMTRTQVIFGRDWRDPSSYRNVTTFKPNHFGEGADMWHDASTDPPSFHMLSHNGNLKGTTCGKHYYSVDLVSWVTWGCAYQAKGVAFADGTKRDFGRRERPHMIFAPPADGAAAADAVGGAAAEAAGAGASAPVPVALSTAVTAVPSSCTGHPCLWRYPDASYTLLQAISHQR
jgi:hypothetical protein